MVLIIALLNDTHGLIRNWNLFVHDLEQNFVHF